MQKKKHSTWEILFGESIVPRYIPLSHRLFLLLNKLSQSIKRRYFTSSVETHVLPDENIEDKHVQFGVNDKNSPVINKTVVDIDLDLEKPEFKDIINALEELREDLKAAGLCVTNFAGNFKSKDYIPVKERNKLWENVSVLSAMRCDPNDAILDIGGASTLFSFYVASRGCAVSVVDNDWGNNGIVRNAKHVAKSMKWNMDIYRQDVSQSLPFRDETFDKVFSICVLEHLKPAVRQKLMKEINRVLKPGGLVGLTIDYDTGRDLKGFDKGIRYAFKSRLVKDIVEPSGMKLYGNATLLDDCPDEFFLGTLFLQKDK